MARAVYGFQSLNKKTAIGKQGTKPCRSRFHGVDQAMLETTLDRMVRKSAEETLNAMLDASGRRDHRRRALRAQRGPQGVWGRKAYGAGHYGRDLTVKAGRMSLKVPKLSGRRNGAGNGSRTLPDRC